MKKSKYGKAVYKNPVLITAFIKASPIILGYVSIGFAYGIIAQKGGISPLNTLLMSVIVFAGSAQLIAVGLFSAGISPLSIILTTFIVNLRHFLMSAALSPYLKKWRKRELALFAYELTDETFAVHSAGFSELMPVKREVFYINIFSQTAWISGSFLGVVSGQLITNVKPFAVDYALPAMFIGLLALQIKSGIQVIVAVTAGVLSMMLLVSGLEQWNIIIATAAAATLGVVLKKWIKE